MIRIREIKVLIFNIPTMKKLGNIDFIEIESIGLIRMRYNSSNTKRNDKLLSYYTGYFNIDNGWNYYYLFIFKVYYLRAD
jgi:hypothetical protein